MAQRKSRKTTEGSNARAAGVSIAQTASGAPDDTGRPVGADAGTVRGVEQAMSRHDSGHGHDTTVKKVSGRVSPGGGMGQKDLASGKRVSMRLWENEQPHHKEPTRRKYETVGYVISGRAELEIEGQRVTLEPGDSWLVPAGSLHCYHIKEPFTALEATAPPAEVHGRDLP